MHTHKMSYVHLVNWFIMWTVIWEINLWSYLECKMALNLRHNLFLQCGF
jgi:hypothetical protein